MPGLVMYYTGARGCSAPSLAILSPTCALWPTAMPEVLPPELISEIVSHLDPASIQDLDTLAACNLVSLMFSAASRPVLFHTIYISAELTVHGFYERSVRNDAAIIDLKYILSKSPHLSRHVRVIYYLDAVSKETPLETGNTTLTDVAVQF